MSSSEGEWDERLEREERAERDARWAPTHTRMDLLPAMREGPRIVRQRVDILEDYDEASFRRTFR